MAGKSKLIDGELHKECPVCKVFLALERFFKQPQGLHGRTSICKGCTSECYKSKRAAVLALLSANAPPTPGDGVFIGPAQEIRCIHCELSKPIVAYCKNRNLEFGRLNICSTCRSHYRTTGVIASASPDRSPIEFKVCRNCDYCLPVARFRERIDKDRKERYSSEAICKECESHYRALYRQSNKERNIDIKSSDAALGSVHCSKCHNLCLVQDMPIDRTKPSGRKSICVTCVRDITKSWLESDSPKVLALREKDRQRSRDTKNERNLYMKTKRRADPVSDMWNRSRLRAKIKGREFTITKEDIVWNDTCPVFGVRLVSCAGKSRRGARFAGGPDSPSLDRIDSTKGYVPGNVAVISWRANNLKSDITIAELEAILAYMKANLPAPPNQSQSAA